jgi:hypothetical protein
LRKLSGSAYSYILIIVAMLVVIGVSLKMQYFASRLLPFLIGSIVLVLAAVALLKEIREGPSPKPGAGSAGAGPGGKTAFSARDYLRVAAWVVGFLLALYGVGFIVATLLFVGAYMKCHGSSWTGAIITPVIFVGLIHLVFNFALHADLYKGQLLMRFGF